MDRERIKTGQRPQQPYVKCVQFNLLRKKKDVANNHSLMLRK